VSSTVDPAAGLDIVLPPLTGDEVSVLATAVRLMARLIDDQFFPGDLNLNAEVRGLRRAVLGHDEEPDEPVRLHLLTSPVEALPDGTYRYAPLTSSEAVFAHAAILWYSDGLHRLGGLAETSALTALVATLSPKVFEARGRAILSARGQG
jgi:hypothetical protein